MSALFDLTGPSFAALRLPAALAAFAFLFGPATSPGFSAPNAAISPPPRPSPSPRRLPHRRPHRLRPLRTHALLQSLRRHHRATSKPPTPSPRDNKILLYGDQSYGSSIPFYLGRQVSLVDGRSTSMLFGSHLPRRPANLPHAARPPRAPGAPANASSSSSPSKARRRRPSSRHQQNPPQRKLRQSPLHRPPTRPLRDSSQPVKTSVRHAGRIIKPPTAPETNHTHSILEPPQPR